VAVCLEKGQKAMAFTALKWLVVEHNIPEVNKHKLSLLSQSGTLCLSHDF